MKVQDYLTQQKVPYNLHEHVPAYTAQEMAAEEHVTGNKTAKPVIVRAQETYAMCVLPASRKLDLNKVARALKVDSVRLAGEDEMADLFPDTEIGAEPPFGKLYNLPTLVDPRLGDNEEVVFQAGTHRHAITMKATDYVGLVEPIIADLCVQR